MKCQKCGAELQPGVKFCTECGARVETLSAAQNTSPPIDFSLFESNPSPAQSASQSAPQPQAGFTSQSQTGFTSQSQTGFTSQSQGYTSQRTTHSAPQSAPQPQAIFAPQPQEIILRSHATGGANALLISLTVLITAILLLVYLMIMPGRSSGGKGSGSGGSGAAGQSSTAAGQSGQQSASTDSTAADPAAANQPDPAANPDTIPDLDTVPAEILSLINTSAVTEAYNGNYNGSITYDFYGADFLKSMGMPADDIEAYKQIAGKTYSCTAVIADEHLTGYSKDYPFASDDGQIFSTWIIGGPENGLYENGEEGMEGAYRFEQVSRIYFLTDGSLYVMEGIVVRENDVIRGGAIYHTRLMPQG